MAFSANVAPERLSGVSMTNEDLDLGRLLGRREAFTMVAARCSAADADCLRRIRDERLYLNHSKDWDEFCSQFLHICKSNANRLIRLLEEFGPSYFEVAQLTRISPATYRAIAPAVHDQALRHNGETIALIPENAEKVAAAVADLRKSSAPSAPPPADPIPALEKSCADLVGKIEGVIALREYPNQVRAAICSLQTRLDMLSLSL
jgi:hypothetical protein